MATAVENSYNHGRRIAIVTAVECLKSRPGTSYSHGHKSAMVTAMECL